MGREPRKTEATEDREDTEKETEAQCSQSFSGSKEREGKPTNGLTC